MASDVYSAYRRIGHTPPFTCRAVTQKLETQNQKEDQISIRTTPDNAEFEVFSDSRRFFHYFFLEKVTLYGEVTHLYVDKWVKPVEDIMVDSFQDLGEKSIAQEPFLSLSVVMCFRNHNGDLRRYCESVQPVRSRQ